MHWIAPSEKDTHTVALEKRLWDAADQFRANSDLKSQEYSARVAGPCFPALCGSSLHRPA
jgi:type I restriction enzyme M protein